MLKIVLYILFIQFLLSDPASAQSSISGTRGMATQRGTLDAGSIVRSRLMAINPVEQPWEAPLPLQGPERRRISGQVSTEQQIARRPNNQQGTAGAIPALVASFAGLGDNNSSIPPDTHGAAGPDHLMVTLNTEVRIQDRTSNVVSTVTLSTFWAGFYNSRPFDPKVLYDHMSGRWMFTVMADPAASTSSVLIAVSQSTDPTGLWNIYRIDADASNIAWADYPSIGYNKDWIVIQVNMFTISGSNYTGSNIYVFDKSDLYAGGEGLFTLFQDFSGGFTQTPAITYDASLETIYLVENWFGNDEGVGTLRLTTITGAVGAEVYTQDVAFPGTSETWSDDTPTTNFAPQSGTSTKIMTNDARMQNTVYRNGSIWSTHTIFLPAGGTPDRSAIQWWEISPSGDVLQRGRIDDAINGKYYAFPSIAVNQNSDVVIGYSRFGADQFASANYAFRSASDPPGTLQGDTELKAGEAKYVKTFGSGRNRWGDYSNTMVDPVDDTSFWTIQQYAEEPVSGTDRWGTWWGQIASIQVDPEITVIPSAIDFGMVDGGEEHSEPLHVRNDGTANLNITNISASVFSVDNATHTIAVGDSASVTVSLLTTITGTLLDTLLISSNDPVVPEVKVPVSALSIYRGDLDGNGKIDVLDVIKFVRILIGMDPAPEPESTGFYVADANGDGVSNVIDVVHQINVILNIQTRPTAGSPSGRVSLDLESPLTLPNGKMAIPVRLDSDNPVAAIQVEISYDSDVLRLESPILSDVHNQMTIESFQVDGILKLIIYSVEGQQVSAGNSTLLYIPTWITERHFGDPYVVLDDVVFSDRFAIPVEFSIGNSKVKVTDIPSEYSLQSNAPNPFNPSTSILYEIPRQSHITLIVYNHLGQEIIRLVDEEQSPGRYVVEWQGVNSRGAPVASGVYVYRLSSGTGFSASRRMLLLK